MIQSLLYLRVQLLMLFFLCGEVVNVFMLVSINTSRNGMLLALLASYVNLSTENFWKVFVVHIFSLCFCLKCECLLYILGKWKFCGIKYVIFQVSNVEVTKYWCHDKPMETPSHFTYIIFWWTEMGNSVVHIRISFREKLRLIFNVGRDGLLLWLYQSFPLLGLWGIDFQNQLTLWFRC